MENEYALRLNQLQAWARAGDANAQYRLGKFFLEEKNPLRDPRQALQRFQLALKGGCVHASLAIGRIHLKGLVGKPAPEKGFQSVLKGALDFDRKAFAPLGRLYLRGIGVKEDFGAAFLWHSRAAETGNAKAYYPLAKLLLNGQGHPPDPARAFTWIIKAREAGRAPQRKISSLLRKIYLSDFELPEGFDRYLPQLWKDLRGEFPAAALPLAKILLRETDNPRFNPQKAKRLLWRATLLAVIPAYRRLADFFAGPHASPKELEEARGYYMGAAHNGCGHSNFVLYESFAKGGLGVAPDPKIAIWFLRRATRWRYPPALVHIASLLDKGEGVPQSHHAAYLRLKEAAELGYAPAFFPMGEKFRLGEGTKVDLKKAFIWTLKAAESGDERAYGPVARALREGLGTKANPAEARRWEEKSREEKPLPSESLFS
ncbi:MAG: hypothetical protein LBO66_07095 [Deltaproteobacteria bacterium]|jgi:TPR repeat protein|nr:hypothetical protein [Deltaproteobacteria bacterium]